MQQKVIKTGNSLAVTIPADFVQNVGIKPGNLATVSTDITTAKMILTFSNPSQLPLLSGKN